MTYVLLAIAGVVCLAIGFILGVVYMIRVMKDVTIRLNAPSSSIQMSSTQMPRFMVVDYRNIN